VGFLDERCFLRVFDESIFSECKPFDCGDTDLNEFFSKDVLNYSHELLGKSYCFTLASDQSQIIAAFTISNDSIKTFTLPNARRKKINSDIPRQKQMKSYPAVLIGRLGVNVDFRKIQGERKSIGDQLLDFIKAWFIDKSNKTGCRFIVVDAYNKETPMRYYKRNGFVELFSTEGQEKEYTNMPADKDLSTRLLYFDLIILAE
jgi:GNAT superfamily N-acetyltransferase